MRTYSTRPKDIRREWWLIDAADQTLGRMAAQVARLLMGKHKPVYATHLDAGDYVVIVNAAKVRVTGRKAEQKLYYRHSGYPGGLKSPSFQELFNQDPVRVVELAVKGMLPHTSLGRAMFKKLKVYPGQEHRHEAQASLFRSGTRPVVDYHAGSEQGETKAHHGDRGRAGENEALSKER